MFCTIDVSKIPCLKSTNYVNMHKWFIIAYLFHYYIAICKLSLVIKWWAIFLKPFLDSPCPKMQTHQFKHQWLQPFRFYVHKTLFLLLSMGPSICLHILHCPSKGLSRNWADFWNLRCEYFLNHWSDLSEINCNGCSFKSSLIWCYLFNQRHKTMFGCCIASTSLLLLFTRCIHYYYYHYYY